MTVIVIFPTRRTDRGGKLTRQIIAVKKEGGAVQPSQRHSLRRRLGAGGRDAIFKCEPRMHEFGPGPVSRSDRQFERNAVGKGGEEEEE